MQDKLEDFFKENRGEFDLESPPEQVWRSINRDLQRKKRYIRNTYYATAASLLLVIGSFFWLMHPSEHKTALADNAGVVVPNVIDTETYYTTLIEHQRAQLEQFSNAYPDVCKDFVGEIDTLNQLYGQLKIEYKSSNGNEAVLQAMIENLRTQVELLNRQMQVILTIKQKENKKAEKNS
jgi:hypothetical protein